ncbi:AAA-like domain-containing protein [Cronbergia sp. UHCC 0137]|uniref:WD40 domain-containing protein n=1 Tax=Cronbergia sp. UHCC 0137 TaxID=3110239 RepID=UPI002B1E9565|nr:AAA-like domain-containing protein [Cronbergia sp. UHCC 0137]MEA5618261.1 AAA-like domain-containing protein [Cronbergia sp. UHCC 0137]
MSSSFYKVGGTLPTNSPSYVIRKADTELFNLLKQGEYCYVFNSRQMGKSSIKDQTQYKLKKEGFFCIDIDLQGIGTQVNHQEWYVSFIYNLLNAISLEQQIEIDLGSWIESRPYLSSSQLLNNFVSHELLTLVQKKIVIFIDEIDCSFSLPFRDNFFALIRFFYNQRNQNINYQRLTFCLLGVATPSDLIKNPVESPFNIGKAVELNGFEFHESLVLAEGLKGLASNERETLKQVLYWTGGQPFLTQTVCDLLVKSDIKVSEGKEQVTIQQFVYSQIIKNWHDYQHFDQIKTRLIANENRVGTLLEIYQYILKHGTFLGKEKEFESELRLSGLVVRRNGGLEVFNPIYQEIFNQDWVQEQLDTIRPYYQSFNLWLSSGKNPAYLLTGEVLIHALAWKQNKSISKDDEQFLNDSKLTEQSHEFGKQLAIENEAKQILELAKQQADKDRKIAEQEKQKARRLLIVSITASLLVLTGTLIFAFIQVTKAEKASQKANQATQELTNTKKERDRIGKQITRVSRERSQIELRAKEVNQQLILAQGNLKRLETDRNKAQQQVGEFQVQKIALEKERQVILKQKQKAEVQNQKNQNELEKIELNLQVNRQKLEQFVRSLQRAEQLRQVAIKGTQLEREGTNIIRRFLSGTDDQIELLIESMKIGQELKQLVGNKTLDQYLAISPLNALQNILDYSREKNRFGDIPYTDKFVVIPNNQHLAFISTFGDTTAITDLKGNVITRLKSEFGKDSVREVAFSSKGRILATVAMDNTTRILDFDGKLLAEFEVFEEVLRNSYGFFFSPVLSMVFSPDAKLLATGMRKNTIRLWDIKGNLIKEFKGHKGGVNSVAFSPNGQFIASGSDDNTIRLWDLKGNSIQEFKGHQQSVKSVTFSPDGQFIASGANDNTIRIWDLKGNLIEEFKGHQKGVNSVVFSPNGQFIASGADDDTVRLWDLKGNLIEKFKGHEQSVKSVAFSLDGLSIFSSSDDETVRVWDLQSSFIREFKEHWPNVRSITFNRDGNLIATASDNKAGRVWDLKGNLIVKLEGHQDWVTSIAFSPDSQLLFTSSWDKKIRIWNRQGSLIKEFKAYDEYINDMVLSPDGKLIATVPMGDTVKVWDIKGNLLKQFKFKKSIFLTISFSHDSKLLAMGLSKEIGRLEGIQGKDLVLAVVLDLDGNIVTKLKGHKKDVRSVAFSPDDQLVATASEDGTTRVWNLKGNLIRELKGHEGSVNSVVFSPDGQLIATGSNDKTIRLWDLKGNVVREFRGHRRGVSTIAFSPDGKYLVSGASDGTARLWRTVESLDELLTRGCHRLSDYFISHPKVLRELPVCEKILHTP